MFKLQVGNVPEGNETQALISIVDRSSSTVSKENHSLREVEVIITSSPT